MKHVIRKWLIRAGIAAAVIIAGLVAIAALGGHVIGSAWSRDAGTDALLRRHIAWIVANSDYEYHGEPLPDVYYYPQIFLQELRHGAEIINIPDTLMPTIYGMYDHTSDDLLFPEGFDIRARENQHVLLHELVHYLQDLRGEHETTDCLAELELPAYRLHMAYAEEQGVDSDNSGLFDVIVTLQACRGEGSYLGGPG